MVLLRLILAVSLPLKSSRWLSIWVLWGAIFILLPPCLAQDKEEADSPIPPKVPNLNALPNVLNDGTLDLKLRLYLPDEQGNPVLLPSEQLGDYVEYKRKQKTLSNPRERLPNYVLDEVSVQAQVVGSYAELSAKFDVTLSEIEPEVASIPLRFDSCKLTEAPTLVGEGRSMIDVRGEERGYRWFIYGAAASKHSAILKGEAVITREGERSELQISLPLARSSITIKLPPKAIDDSVRGQGGEVVERVANSDAIELRIIGSGGDVSISWRESDTRSRMSAVEATSTTRMQIDDPRQPWKVNTDLTLRWFGRDANDRVVLELPQGARWLQLPLSVTEQYSITYQAEPALNVNETPSPEKPSPEKPSPEKPSPEKPNPEKPDAGLAVSPLKSDTAHAAEPQVSPVKLTVRNLVPSRTQPLDLRLEWEWEPPKQLEESDDKPMEMPGLVVQGVDSHTGTVEFVLPASYAPSWRENVGTQFVQQGRLSDVIDRTQYIFRFNRQPIQLTANFRRESNMSVIRPMYLAHIDRNKIKLTAWLDCSFDASQPIAVSMLPGDWLVESAEAVEMSAPNASGEALNIQLQKDGAVLINNTDPTLLEYDEQRRLRQVWRVIAYRTWTPDENNAIEFPLPQLQQGSSVHEQTDYDHGSGVLIVTCSENLLLKWQDDKGTGLLVDSLVPQWEPLLGSPRYKNPLVFRFQSRGALPTWSGIAEPLPQQIALQQLATLDVVSEVIRINQKITLQIAHEPLTNLRIAVRKDALSYQEPHVMIDGVPVALRPINRLEPAAEVQTGQAQANEISTESAVVNASTSTTEFTNETNTIAEPLVHDSLAWQIFEPVTIAPLRGSVDITIRSSLPWKSQSPEQLTEVQVPLVQLITPRVTRDQVQTWSISANRDIEVLESDAETRNTGSVRLMPVGAKPRELSLGQAEISVNLRKLESLTTAPVRIARSWLQTILNGNERRDRYCVQVESQQKRIAVRIPTGSELMLVTVDGFIVTDWNGFFTDAGKQYQIDLPNNSLPMHQIEVWMNSTETLSWVTPLKIEIPEIEGALAPSDRLYWQLVIPSIHHLGVTSMRMTPEWTWVWGGLWWERDSGLSQADLENWVGAVQQTELSGSVNSYVLSSFGNSRSFQVWILSRFVLWIPVGLVAILLSILLLSFRPLRHPVFLLLLAGLILSASMLAPDLAVLLGQTAILSLGIVALILITQAAIETRVRRRSVFTVRPSTQSERSDHLSIARNVKAVAPISTRAHSSVVAEGGK